MRSIRVFDWSCVEPVIAYDPYDPYENTNRENVAFSTECHIKYNKENKNK